ncbi:hypothetical protein AB2L28_20600 [Kineococcus sp. TBRC 1896]|uniref:Uncharacterized protein n=1 Tax=Kineococcus mangrovi TaxID=1660183 RepID=A0ABV4I7K2_9ACTN
MTNFKTALAGLRASLRSQLFGTSGAIAPVSSELTTEVFATAQTRPPRVRRTAKTSPRIRCLQPTSQGTPCGKWVLLIDSITHASGCWWHATKVERMAWHAARRDLAQA